jgi:hypothetical protein
MARLSGSRDGELSVKSRMEELSDEARRRAIACATTLTAYPPLAPQAYERRFPECFARGERAIVNSLTLQK